MDGNKDEAIKCIEIAKEAISSGNKQKALKFIKIATRLNNQLPVNHLLTAIEQIDSRAPGPSENSGIGARNYTSEHVELIREVNKHKDYYAVLGVEKTCHKDEIRKAYRKLSLKIHPDKNKAPGAEDAFKKVCKAFKCLSDDGSRMQYDQTGFVDGDVRRRRRRTTGNDEFDPDEIFRAVFGQSGVFRTSRHVYSTRGTGASQRGEFNNGGGGGPNLMVFLQLVPLLLILLMAYLPFSEPEYSLQRNYSYQYSRVTERYGVEFFVKSEEFDRSYPIGSVARDNIEDNVIQDYKSLLGRYCRIEHQRQWNRNLPTPYCDKLRSFEVAQG